MGVRVGPSTTPPEREPDDSGQPDINEQPELEDPRPGFEQPAEQDPPAHPAGGLLDGRQRADSAFDTAQQEFAVRPWLRRIDLVVLPLVFLLDVLVFSSLLRSDVTTTERVGIVAYSALGVALLAFRHRAPLLVFGVVLAHSLLALLTTELYVPVLILLVALEAVAELRPMRVSLTALAAVAAPTALLVLAAAREASPDRQITAATGSAIFYGALTIAAFVIGRTVRRHRGRLFKLHESHQWEVQQQRAAAEQAVSIERLRIARELHDIVAHSVTIMVLHAAGAKRVVDTDPDRAKDSLTTIEQSGQQAMGELRRLLELLRENEGDSTTRPGSPLPGLAQLPQMVSSVRGSGIDVSLTITGTPGRLDTSIELAAYRLVQEALTNVSKHRGSGAGVTVSIDWGAEKMTVAVEDDGAGATELLTSLSTGNGLAGLRERISIAGGDFVAGATESGGFRVAARLPVSSLPGAAAGGAVGLPIQADRAARGSGQPATGPGFARVDP
ncbi:MAG: histidine kinase [Nakamurella sp.]